VQVVGAIRLTCSTNVRSGLDLPMIESQQVQVMSTSRSGIVHPSVDSTFIILADLSRADRPCKYQTTDTSRPEIAEMDVAVGCDQSGIFQRQGM
jgi:hypothetical protein